MEARKVQLTGGSTYAVSLPKSWARDVKLEAGDLVFIEPREDMLVLRPKPAEDRGRGTKVLEVEKKEPREHILRKLIGAYVTGYQFMDLRFPPAEATTARETAREFSRMVIGAEVVEETTGRVLIQDLANPMDLSPDKCLRRMYMTVRAMMEDSFAALRTRDARKAADVPPRDQDVDRLYWMVAKQYHVAITDPSYLGTYSLRGKLHHFRTVAKLLERIGDHAEKIAGAVLDLGETQVDEGFQSRLEEAASLALDILEKAFTALMAHNLDTANAALDAGRALESQVDRLSREVTETNGERVLPLATMIDSVHRVGGYAADIAEVAINDVIGGEGE